MIAIQHMNHFQAHGFVAVRGLLDREEALAFRQAALDFRAAHRGRGDSAIFTQLVNVWTEDETMKSLTLHPKVTAAAKALAQTDLRLWHDQLLIKDPGKSLATEFHQDQPYWPHRDSPDPISIWIALGDVPVESGCMTFLPGSHRRTDLPMQILSDAESLFTIAPDLRYAERVTVPLRAGDVTFHHGRCAHMANPNTGEDVRVAHVAIFMPATTRYSGAAHIVTDPLGLREGDLLAGELFPAV
jgi:ectoine hydroxylase-related dioxygenase (phytanoyl-CoA dioxygenase family)